MCLVFANLLYGILESDNKMFLSCLDNIDMEKSENNVIINFLYVAPILVLMIFSHLGYIDMETYDTISI